MVYPDLTWSISYYGSCPTQSVLYPITETPLNELDMKKVFSGVHQIDGVPLKTYWGRMAKSAETPWIMKPQSLFWTYIFLIKSAQKKQKKD